MWLLHSASTGKHVSFVVFIFFFFFFNFLSPAWHIRLFIVCFIVLCSSSPGIGPFSAGFSTFTKRRTLILKRDSLWKQTWSFRLYEKRATVLRSLTFSTLEQFLTIIKVLWSVLCFEERFEIVRNRIAVRHPHGTIEPFGGHFTEWPLLFREFQMSKSWRSGR